MCFTRKLALISRVAYRRFTGVHTAQGKKDRRTLDGTEGEIGLWCGYNKGPARPIQELQRLPRSKRAGPAYAHVQPIKGWRLAWKGEKCHSWAELLPKGLRVEACLAAGGIDASFLGGSWAEHHSTHPSYCVLCKCYWTRFFRQANHWSKSLLSDITDNLWWQ